MTLRLWAFERPLKARKGLHRRWSSPDSCVLYVVSWNLEAPGGFSSYLLEDPRPEGSSEVRFLSIHVGGGSCPYTLAARVGSSVPFA